MHIFLRIYIFFEYSEDHSYINAWKHKNKNSTISPTYMVRAEGLGQSPTDFSGTLAGRWIRVNDWDLNVTIKWDTGIRSSSLIFCAATRVEHRDHCQSRLYPY